MEFDEFNKFIQELNIKIEGLTTADLFKKIDSDGSGKIEFEEFAKYYKELTSGLEFQPIFEQYSRSKTFLTIEEFKKFINETQKTQNFELFDAIHLFCEFCENMPKEVKEKIRQTSDERDNEDKLE
jgi:hypothetical protein